MGLEKDFLLMGSTTMTVEPFTSMDLYGAPSYGAGASYSVVLDSGVKMIMRPDGQSEQANGTFYVLSTSASISLNDRITIPGSTLTPRILGVATYYDDRGQHHVEVAVI